MGTLTKNSCMKVAGKFSDPNLLMPSGKRNMKNFPRDLQRNCQNGSERDQARRLVHLTLQKARRKVVMTHLQQRKRKNMTKRRKKKKRRRRSKQSSQKCNL